MHVSKAKRLVALVLAAGAAVALAAVLLVSGLVVLNSGSGADPAEAFLEIPVVPENLEELVTWLPDRELVREVEPDTRSFVESSWVSAWQRVDVAQRTGTRDLIDTWFMPGLAEHVVVSAGIDQVGTVGQFGHDFEVTFYSLDGSVLGVTIQSDLERRLAGGPALRSIETFEVVFLLSDGNWRVQHATLVNADEL